MNNNQPSAVPSNDSPELSIQISFRTSVTPTALLALTGNIVKSNLKLLSSAFNECLTNGKNTVIVDLKKVDVVSSAGWKQLVEEEKRLKSKEVTLFICGLQPKVQTGFTDLQLHGALKTFATVTECQKEIELISEYQKNASLKETFQIKPKPSNLETDTPRDTIELNSKPSESIPDKMINQPGRSVPEKILAIISKHGPCSLLQILSYLHSTEFENEKIGLFKLMKILKEMNCESRKKRERVFRSC